MKLFLVLQGSGVEELLLDLVPVEDGYYTAPHGAKWVEDAAFAAALGKEKDEGFGQKVALGPNSFSKDPRAEAWGELGWSACGGYNRTRLLGAIRQGGCEVSFGWLRSSGTFVAVRVYGHEEISVEVSGPRHSVQELGIGPALEKAGLRWDTRLSHFVGHTSLQVKMQQLESRAKRDNPLEPVPV